MKEPRGDGFGVCIGPHSTALVVDITHGFLWSPTHRSLIQHVELTLWTFLRFCWSPIECFGRFSFHRVSMGLLDRCQFFPLGSRKYCLLIQRILSEKLPHRANSLLSKAMDPLEDLLIGIGRVVWARILLIRCHRQCECY